jgi:hypothetical protein
MFKINNDDVSIIDSVIRNGARKEEIQLYEEMSLALDLMNTENNFCVLHKYVEKDTVYFEIATDYPNDLPINVGTLFFNADLNFDVQIKEYQHTCYPENRFFNIHLKKCNI